MSNFFPPPMDRADVLHEPSHAYVVWWKITPDQKPIGQMRFDKIQEQETGCEVSIYLIPNSLQLSSSV